MGLLQTIIVSELLSALSNWTYEHHYALFDGE